MLDLSQERMKRSVDETQQRLPDANQTDDPVVITEECTHPVVWLAIGSAFGYWWANSY